MRSIYLWSLSLLLLCFSGVSSASTLVWWYTDLSSVRHADPSTACDAAVNYPYFYFASFSWDTGGPCHGTYNEGSSGPFITNVRKGTEQCSFGHQEGAIQCNASCDAPNVMENGQCVSPPPDACSANTGQPTGWKKTWPSFDAYDSDSAKPKCTTSQNGCAVDICGQGGSSSCGQSGSTGEYACFGNGTYTGVSQAPSEGGDVDGCEGAACQPPPPVTSSSDQSCTPNQGGTFTCTRNDVTEQFSSSQCTVGSVGGATGYQCVKPDYVPQSDNKTTTDVVTDTTNPDGSSTKVTDTTVDRTTCKAGTCSTTTTTTTTTNNTNSDGSPGSSSTECTGDKCDNPATPEDESEEEEEVERTAEGGECSAALVCEGDAIDCAILEQQKLMRCSMDWETQKGAVLAEAGKPEYALETEERDVAGFFTGPSTARWLTASCPADRVINLATTGTSITFSWDFVCQYASGLGNLLVALASLFFAVYVGRAFGGS